MFYRQRTYELTNNGVRSSEEVHVECMVIQQSCVRSSQSRDVEYVGSERWSHADACLDVLLHSFLYRSSLAASQTDNPLQCLELVQPSHTDLSNALLIYGLNRS